MDTGKTYTAEQVATYMQLYANLSSDDSFIARERADLYRLGVPEEVREVVKRNERESKLLVEKVESIFRE